LRGRDRLYWWGGFPIRRPQYKSGPKMADWKSTPPAPNTLMITSQLKFTWLATFVLSILCIVGCDLFSTRAPEPPDGGGNSGWRFPSSPSIVLDNLSSSVGRRSSSDYIRTLAAQESGLPNFEFIPDQQTATINPGVFDGWNLDREVSFGQSLFAPANLPLDSLAVLDLTVERQTSIADTAIISCSYHLHLGLASDRAPRDMTGRAEYRILKANDGGWYIQRWTDARVAGESCWSDLKAAL